MSGGLIGYAAGGCWIVGHEWTRHPVFDGRLLCPHCGSVR